MALETRSPEPGQELALAELRARAMRESLTAAGRWDEVRVRRRFLDGYRPETTLVLWWDASVAGFFVVEDREDHLFLAHLYVDPEFQGRGLGRAVLSQVQAQARAQGVPLRLNALKGSRANGFYRSCGFTVVGEDEWDTFYEDRSVLPGKA